MFSFSSGLAVNRYFTDNVKNKDILHELQYLKRHTLKRYQDFLKITSNTEAELKMAPVR